MALPPEASYIGIARENEVRRDPGRVRTRRVVPGVSLSLTRLLSRLLRV